MAVRETNGFCLHSRGLYDELTFSILKISLSAGDQTNLIHNFLPDSCCTRGRGGSILRTLLQHYSEFESPNSGSLAIKSTDHAEYTSNPLLIV